MLKTALALVYFIFCGVLAMAQSRNETTEKAVYPANIHYSFAQGIVHNPGLETAAILKYAQEVVSRTWPKNKITGQLKKLEQLTREQLIEIAVQTFPIDYVEVSESKLRALGQVTSDESKFYPEEAEQSPLKFKKDGEVYYRWFIHPLRKNLDFLNDLGSPEIQRGRFLAQFTESRSLPVFDQNTGGIWSIKTSVPQGISSLERKPFSSEGARQQFAISEEVQKLEKNGTLEEHTYFPEVQAVGFVGSRCDEGLLVRSLKLIKPHQIFISYSAVYMRGLWHYLPAKMQSTLMKIELQVLAKKAAKKNGRFTALTGWIQNSHHAQNGGVLIDAEAETVEPINRDLDFYYDGFNSAKIENLKYLGFDAWKLNFQIDFKMRNFFGNHPLFYSESDYAKIHRAYLETFQETFLNLNGYHGPVPEIPDSTLKYGVSFGSMHQLIENESLEVLSARAQAQLDTQIQAFKEATQAELKKDPARFIHRYLTDGLRSDIEPRILIEAMQMIHQQTSVDSWRKYIESPYFARQLKTFQNKSEVTNQDVIWIKNFHHLAASGLSESFKESILRVLNSTKHLNESRLVLGFFAIAEARMVENLKSNTTNTRSEDVYMDIIRVFLKDANQETRDQFLERYPYYILEAQRIPLPTKTKSPRKMCRDLLGP